MAVEAEHIEHAPTSHVVQFYDSVDDLTFSVGRFLRAGLDAGEVVVVVADASHREAFAAHLAAGGVDVTSAKAQGDLVLLDAASTMARFVVDGRPDPDRFDAVIGTLMRDAAEGGRIVRAYGEMVAKLWDQGLVNAAIELEDLWNELGHQVAFSLLCAYPAASVSHDDLGPAFAEVCRLHSAVVESRAFAMEASGPGQARRFVLDVLHQWGQAAVADDAALVVTELATNAISHAQSRFTVTLTQTAGRVRMAVRDDGRVAPTERVAAPMESSGRGLALVRELAYAWGIDVVENGKVVWAELGPDPDVI